MSSPHLTDHMFSYTAMGSEVTPESNKIGIANN